MKQETRFALPVADGSHLSGQAILVRRERKKSGFVDTVNTETGRKFQNLAVELTTLVLLTVMMMEAETLTAAAINIVARLHSQELFG